MLFSNQTFYRRFMCNGHTFTSSSFKFFIYLCEMKVLWRFECFTITAYIVKANIGLNGRGIKYDL